MASSEPDGGVRLKNTESLHRLALFILGMYSSVFVPPGVVAMLRGEWAGLLCVTSLAAIVALIRLVGRIEPEDHVILYPDRMEWPGYGTRKIVYRWSEVQGIRWPSGRESHPSIKIMVPRDEQRDLPSVRLQALSWADRVTLIRYLRERGAEVEQEGWPRFCHRCAVAWVERSQRAQGERAIPALFSSMFERPSFLAGMLFPLVWLALLVCAPRFVARKVWWTLSALIAVSSVINIRLVWGHWSSPFTEICLGFAGVLFLLGLPARSDPGRPKRRDGNSWAPASSLAMALIGMPLMLNAVAINGIPKQFLGWVFFGGLFLVFLPILVDRLRQQRRERQRAPELEADALRRWAVYESTGRLPEGELPG